MQLDLNELNFESLYPNGTRELVVVLVRFELNVQYKCKEDRYYTTRGSGVFDDSSKVLFANPKEENRKMFWPKLLITLSSKEKEEDFMAMKGCKTPQRPKKRAKLIQRTILLVSPDAWLTDLC